MNTSIKALFVRKFPWKENPLMNSVMDFAFLSEDPFYFLIKSSNVLKKTQQETHLAKIYS